MSSTANVAKLIRFFEEATKAKEKGNRHLTIRLPGLQYLQYHQMPESPRQKELELSDTFRGYPPTATGSDLNRLPDPIGSTGHRPTKSTTTGCASATESSAFPVGCPAVHVSTAIRNSQLSTTFDTGEDCKRAPAHGVEADRHAGARADHYIQSGADHYIPSPIPLDIIIDPIGCHPEFEWFGRVMTLEDRYQWNGEIRGEVEENVPSEEEMGQETRGLAVPLQKRPPHPGQWPHVLLLPVQFKLARGLGEHRLGGPGSMFNGVGSPSQNSRGFQLMLPRQPSGRRSISRGGSSMSSVCNSAVPGGSLRRGIDQPEEDEERRPEDRVLPKLGVTGMLRFTNGRDSWLDSVQIAAYAEIIAEGHTSTVWYDGQRFLRQSALKTVKSLQDILNGPASRILTIVCFSSHFTAVSISKSVIHHYNSSGFPDVPAEMEKKLADLHIPIRSLTAAEHHVPVQGDDDNMNCGIFCLQMLHAWFEGRKVTQQSQEDLRVVRRRMVRMLAERYRVTYKGTVLSKEDVENWDTWKHEDYLAKKRARAVQVAVDEGLDDEAKEETPDAPDVSLPTLIDWSSDSSRTPTPSPVNCHEELPILRSERCEVTNQTSVSAPSPSASHQSPQDLTSCGIFTLESPQDMKDMKSSSEGQEEQVEVLLGGPSGVSKTDASFNNLQSPILFSSRPPPKRTHAEVDVSEMKKPKISRCFILNCSWLNKKPVRPVVLTNTLAVLGVDEFQSADIASITMIPSNHRELSAQQCFEFILEEHSSRCSDALLKDDLMEKQFERFLNTDGEIVYSLPEKRMAPLFNLLLCVLKNNPDVCTLPNFRAVVTWDLTASAALLESVGREAVLEGIKKFSRRGYESLMYSLKYDLPFFFIEN